MKIESAFLRTTILLNAAGYAGFLFLVLVLPEIFSGYCLFEDKDALNSTSIAAAVSSPLILLNFIVVPQYLVAYTQNSQALLDFMLFQRYPLLLLTLVCQMADTQDPFHGSFLRLMPVVDCLPAILSAFITPGGMTGLLDRMYNKHFKIQDFHAQMFMASFVYACFAVSYSFAVYHNDLSAITTYVATFVPLSVQFGLISAGLEKAYGMPLRILSAAGILIVSEVNGIAAAPLRINAVLQITGCFNTIYGFASTIIGTIILAVDLHHNLGLVQDGLFYMMLGYSFGIFITSAGWIFLFKSSYTNSQNGFLFRIHFQDLTMVVLTIVTAGGLDKLGVLAPGEVGYWPALILPLSLIAFTVHTKVLIHRKIGAPHHPSWWVEGEVPMHDMNNDMVNISFAFTTAVATVGNVCMLIYLMLRTVGVENFSFDAPDLSKFLIIHGIFVVGTSGFWMIFATSGLPPNGWSKLALASSPPMWTNGAIVYVNPKNALAPHKFDIVAGLLLAFLGVFCVGSGDLSPRDDYLFRIGTFAVWAFGSAWKIIVHWADYGYFPPHKPNPYDEIARKGAKEAAKGKAKAT